MCCADQSMLRRNITGKAKGVYVCVCMCVCTYVCMYVCMYVLYKVIPHTEHARLHQKEENILLS